MNLRWESERDNTGRVKGKKKNLKFFKKIDGWSLWYFIFYSVFVFLFHLFSLIYIILDWFYNPQTGIQLEKH